MTQPTDSKRSPWPVRAIALLLLLQAVGLLGFNVYNINSQIGDQAEIRINFDDVNSKEEYDNLPAHQRAIVDALITGILFFPLTIVAIMASVGFLFRQRFGWLLAMLTQNIILAICIMLYLGIRPVIIYPIMTYSILMVLYLNMQEVRLAFHHPLPEPPVS